MASKSNAWNKGPIALLLLSSYACQNFESRAISPLEVHSLSAPALKGTLAIATLVDRRPESERGDEFVEHSLGYDPLFPETPYWALRPGYTGDLEDEADRVLGGIRARYTGAQSFLWYDYPWMGSTTPHVNEATSGISNYLAAVLCRRGFAENVVRIDGSRVNFAADYVLEGTLNHFCGIFTEAEIMPDPYAHYGYGIRVSGWTEVDLSLRKTATGEVLWTGTFFDLDDLSTADEPLENYHPSPAERTFRVWPNHFADWAHQAMCVHAERSLSTTVVAALDALEAGFRQEDGIVRSVRTMPERVFPFEEFTPIEEPALDFTSFGGALDFSSLLRDAEAGPKGSASGLFPDPPRNPFGGTEGAGGFPRRGGGGLDRNPQR